jgi:spore coat protein SA
MPSVAFVVPEMLPVPPVEGGAVEGWVHEVSRALARQGFDVTVVSRPAGAAADAAVQGDGVRHVGVPWTRVGRWLYERKRGWGPGHPLRPVVKVLNVLEYAFGVRRRLRALAPDIVYVHNDPYLAGLLGRPARRALVLHMHNDHLCAKGARPLLRPIVARCDRVLCVSDFIRDRARDAFADQADRFETVLNAIDTGTPALAAARERVDGLAASDRATVAPRFLYAGRLVAEKGVHVLLEAFALLLRALPDARLTIAGSSFFANAPATPFVRALRRQAEGLGHAVEFTGFLPHERLLALYADVDAVVVPSTWDEPFGLVVLEAMAAGACVIASRVGAIPELVEDGRTGLLVPAGDARALACALEAVAADPARRRRLGAAARQEALLRFPLSRLVGELGNCFRALAPPAQAAPPAPVAADVAPAAARSATWPSSKDIR